MIGAQTLWAASMTHHLPPAVGVAVLALGTLVISTGGHKYIIAYGVSSLGCIALVRPD